MPKLSKPTVLLIGCIIMAGGGSCFAAWSYAHRYIPGKVTFQEYTPTYLPEAVTLQKKAIEAWYIPAGRPSRYTMVNLELTNGFVYLRQKQTGFSYICPAGRVRNETCSIGRTPHGQRYILTTTTLKGNTSQALDWLKGDTKVRLVLDSDRGKYPHAELERIIDSFKKVQYQDLPIRYIDKSKV